MVDAVTGVGDPITLKVVKRKRKDGEEMIWMDGKNGEGVVGVGDVGV